MVIMRAFLFSLSCPLPVNFPVYVTMGVPESGDDDPGPGVGEDDLVLGEVDAGQLGLGAAADGVDPAIGADHPVVVSELLLLLRSFFFGVFLMFWWGIGRPWRAGDDVCVVHDAYRHYKKV